MGAQDHGTWLELPFWRQVKYYLICIFIIGPFVWIPLTLIGVYTFWYQILLTRLGQFLLDMWFLTIPVAGILVVIEYYRIRKRLEVKKRTKQLQQLQSQSSR